MLEEHSMNKYCDILHKQAPSHTICTLVSIVLTLRSEIVWTFFREYLFSAESLNVQQSLHANCMILTSYPASSTRTVMPKRSLWQHRPSAVTRGKEQIRQLSSFISMGRSAKIVAWFTNTFRVERHYYELWKYHSTLDGLRRWQSYSMFLLIAFDSSLLFDWCFWIQWIHNCNSTTSWTLVSSSFLSPS